MKIEELISLFRHQTLDLPKLTLLLKTLKAARLAMADRIVLNCTNTEFLAAKVRKKQRAQCIGIQYNGQGACVLSLENVEKKKQLAENKRKDKEVKKLAQKEKQANRYFLQISKNLMQLGSDLIYGPNSLILLKKTKNPGSLARNKKRGGRP